MIVIEIEKFPEPGYPNPVFSWVCPLCNEQTAELQILRRNADQHYIGRRATHHLINSHNVWMSYISVKTVEAKHG